MKTINDMNYLSFKYIIICTVIGLLNSFYYDNFVVMFSLCFLEVVLLLWCLHKRERVTYICYYLIFLVFSMESEVFVGKSTFYGFKNFRIAGLNLAVWMLLPLAVEMVLNYKTILKKAGCLHQTLIKKLSLFTLTGALVGILTYLSNDNGFRLKSGSFSFFINTYYSYFLPYIEIMVFSWAICSHKELLPKLKKVLFSIIIALAIVFIACLVFENYGNRGGFNSLQVSDVYFLLVCSIILIVYPEFNYVSKIVLCVSSVIILSLSLLYNTSGKIVIIAGIIPILMFIITKRNSSSIKVFWFIFLAILLLFFIIFVVFPVFIEKSQLLKIKFLQAQQLLSIGRGNWFDSIPASPRMRISEFLNIGYELLIKPWFLPLGKGFCGTVKDGLGLFAGLSEFDFSEWELQLGAYNTMHESINCFFLVGGLMGLYVIFSILLKLYKNIHKSPWLIFGFVWILLFYNYHLTIAGYGIIALIVGLEDINIRNSDEACAIEAGSR